ncbi:MAG TPA: HD domain-containing protein [Chryseosolibacter sp.]|nr:HD domain-containing protein [Chryseosolibacter sp.]
MELDVILKQVEAFANNAHGSQQRKYTADPYIVHPIRVMEMCRQYTDHLPILCAALLHDVLEDTLTTKLEIESFLRTIMSDSFTEEATSLVEELTDVYVKDKFPRMNRRTRKQKEAERMSSVSANAQTIKYADIFDNTDIAYNDPDFARIYLREAWELLAVMKNGNPDLRSKAIRQVESSMQRLKLLSFPPE